MIDEYGDINPEELSRILNDIYEQMTYLGEAVRKGSVERGYSDYRDAIVKAHAVLPSDIEAYGEGAIKVTIPELLLTEVWARPHLLSKYSFRFPEIDSNVKVFFLNGKSNQLRYFLSEFTDKAHYFTFKKFNLKESNNFKNGMSDAKKSPKKHLIAGDSSYTVKADTESKKFQIETDTNYEVDVKTGTGGKIVIGSDSQCNVEINSGASGKITLVHGTDKIEIDSSVLVETISKAIKLKSTSGNIELSSSSGDIKIESSSGKLKLAGNSKNLKTILKSICNTAAAITVISPPLGGNTTVPNNASDFTQLASDLEDLFL